MYHTIKVQYMCNIYNKTNTFLEMRDTLKLVYHSISNLYWVRIVLHWCKVNSGSMEMYTYRASTNFVKNRKMPTAVCIQQTC